jgi:hypothetical protein
VVLLTGEESVIGNDTVFFFFFFFFIFLKEIGKRGNVTYTFLPINLGETSLLFTYVYWLFVWFEVILAPSMGKRSNRNRIISRVCWRSEKKVV